MWSIYSSNRCHMLCDMTVFVKVEIFDTWHL
jgi:hypothetical protein